MSLSLVYQRRLKLIGLLLRAADDGQHGSFMDGANRQGADAQLRVYGSDMLVIAWDV